jgi:hypothetical protein
MHIDLASSGFASRPGGGGHRFFGNAVPAVALATFARPFAMDSTTFLTDILGFATRH